jgi:hypothetical protein
VLTLSVRRGFSTLPRERRRAILDGWRRSRVPARRRALARLAALVEGCFAAARASGPDQSEPGA